MNSTSIIKNIISGFEQTKAPVTLTHGKYVFSLLSIIEEQSKVIKLSIVETNSAHAFQYTLLTTNHSFEILRQNESGRIVRDRSAESIHFLVLAINDLLKHTSRESIPSLSIELTHLLPPSRKD